jgi:hypothetical protein
MGLVCLASASSLKKYSKDFVVYLAWKSCQCGTFMLKQYSCLSVTGQIYTKTNSEGEREREREERNEERKGSCSCQNIKVSKKIYTRILYYTILYGPI